MAKSSFLMIFNVFILVLPICYSVGQVVNERSHIHVKSGGILYVSGSFENRSSATNDIASVNVEGATSQLVVDGDFFNNSGSIHLIDGELKLNTYKAHIENGDSSELINEGGKVFVSGNWKNEVGKYIETVASEFHLNGSSIQGFFQHEDNLFWHIFFEGGGDKFINGHLITNRAEFVDGIVKCDIADTFAIINVDDNMNLYPSSVVGGSNSSHVEGPLWIEGQGNIDFPIGIDNFYRPLIFSSIPGIVTIKAEVIKNINPEPQIQLEQVISDIAWSYSTSDSLAFLGSLATISFLPGDTTGQGLSNLVVAQGSNDTGDFYSLDNGGTGSGSFSSLISVTSAINPGQAQVLAIGSECQSSKLSMLVKLEGAYRGSTDPYEASALNVNELDRYEDGGDGDFTMFSGYTVPTTAIDLIEIYVREATTPYNYIDTTIAWATNDGSILDFFTGEEGYVEFCDAEIVDGADYMIEVRHRNHTSVMTSSVAAYTANSNVPTTADDVDLTVASNLYGLDPAQLLGGEMYMFKGNVFLQNNDQEINSLDLIMMIGDVRFLLQGYLNSDINLDGSSDTDDYYDLACYTCNSLNLKMSSVP